jgi:hypothetical protein
MVTTRHHASVAARNHHGPSHNMLASNPIATRGNNERVMISIGRNGRGV